jgi:hypothetical protein
VYVRRIVHEMSEGGVADLKAFSIAWAGLRSTACLTLVGGATIPRTCDPVRRPNCRKHNEKPRSLSGYAVVGWNAQEREFGSVHIVHTFGVGLGRTGVGSGRIPHVSGGVQCLRGLECGSSPTSGTHSPSSEGVLLLMC